MALNRAQHVIEHIDSIKEAVVRNKYNIFIPGMKKKKGGFRPKFANCKHSGIKIRVCDFLRFQETLKIEVLLIYIYM